MGRRVEKKIAKKHVPVKLKMATSIYDARRLGMRFLAEARFGARTEIGFKHRILTSQDPEKVRLIIEEIKKIKDAKNKKK